MKKKYFLMCALAGFMFASCSESLPDGGDDGGTLNPDGESWVSLNIQTASQRTKALHPSEIDNGLPNESEVVKVQAIFFDGTNKVTVDKTLALGTEAIPGQPTGTGGKPFKVPNTSKKVLIVVNPVGLPAITEGVTDYATINAAIEGTVSATGTGNNIIGATKEEFMMTNAAGKLEPHVDLENLELHPTEAAAALKPAEIAVDRVSSKVRLYMRDNYTKPATAWVQEIGWVLNVTNKMYYPVSVRTETAKNTATPFDIYGLGSYRIDPNYTNNVGLTYDDNYNYYLGQGPASDSDWNLPGDVEYCLENTQDADDNVHAYTTHVIFKAQFTPKSFTNAGSSAAEEYTEEQAKTLNWIRIGAGYYTFTTLLNHIEEEMASFYGNTGVTPSRTNALSDFLVANSRPKIDTTGFTGTYTEKAALLKTAINDRKDEIEALAGKMYGTFNYYKAGVSFYKIMIKHDNDDDPGFMNQLGEFGVVRNSVYDLTITSISNPGYPEIPEPDPDTKDEDDDGWISIQININPWTWYTQEVPL